MSYTLTLFDTISNASVFISPCFTLLGLRHSLFSGLRNLYEYLCSYGYLRNSLWRENSNLSNQASIRFRFRVNTTVHVRTLAIRKITQKVAIPSSKTGDNSQNIFSDEILVWTIHTVERDSTEEAFFHDNCKLLWTVAAT